MFYIVFIKFVLFQPIISDKDSDAKTCNRVSNCFSVEFSEDYKCCFSSRETELPTFTEMESKCELFSLDYKLTYNQKAHALENEMFYSSQPKEVIQNTYNTIKRISCQEKETIIIETKYSEEDKELLKSEERCLYSYMSGEPPTWDNCKKRKVTQLMKDSGYECGFLTLLKDNEIINVCFPVNTDITQTEELYTSIKNKLNEYEIKEIIMSNGIKMKLEGDKVEIIGDSDNVSDSDNKNISKILNKYKNIFTIFILLFLILLLLIIILIK